MTQKHFNNKKKEKEENEEEKKNLSKLEPGTFH